MVKKYQPHGLWLGAWIVKRRRKPSCEFSTKRKFLLQDKGKGFTAWAHNGEPLTLWESRVDEWHDDVRRRPTDAETTLSLYLRAR